jgi:hypothetical protein
MNDLLPREILARAYIQDALAWSEHEHLVDLAKAHAARGARQSPGTARLHAAIPQALVGLARRVVLLRA